MICSFPAALLVLVLNFMFNSGWILFPLVFILVFSTGLTRLLYALLFESNEDSNAENQNAIAPVVVASPLRRFLRRVLIFIGLVAI